jgi:hypothetical protein
MFPQESAGDAPFAPAFFAGTIPPSVQEEFVKVNAGPPPPRGAVGAGALPARGAVPDPPGTICAVALLAAKENNTIRISNIRIIFVCIGSLRVASTKF